MYRWDNLIGAGSGSRVSGVGDFSGNESPMIISRKLQDILGIEVEKYGGHSPRPFL